uniref:N(2)-citryl-N(6)-acetyl-N(6)-hydroxylysine synthase, aerobactin biosynthesis protein IucA n=1 Tax=Klebsiella pneumoniae TaxID=573 RepID=A0A8B0SZV5_KLEPN|nr:N(2)-citryl-N(6)-acetyl-N(6)-hydroxylysine synthase, aerobactin biosynthesis protein IucA [Klebsiella pneumoniae]
MLKPLFTAEADYGSVLLAHQQKYSGSDAWGSAGRAYLP